MVPMFDESSLKKIDSGYFNIILMDDTLNQAVRSIKGHDKYQLEVRKCV